MVVRVETPDEAPARKAGPVSGATANESTPEERPPFAREYLDYWAPLPESVRESGRRPPDRGSPSATEVRQMSEDFDN